jgi:hypothetical protein
VEWLFFYAKQRKKPACSLEAAKRNAMMGAPLSTRTIEMASQPFKKMAHGLTITMLGIWGVILIVAPQEVAGLFSTEPLNHAFAGMMGAALLGLALISFASISHWISAPRALGLAIGILVVETTYLMLGTGFMLVTPLTTLSLVTAAAISFFLLI